MLQVDILWLVEFPLILIALIKEKLLGATCLFLSSKFKAIEHISSKKLRAYTDDSITEQELKVTFFRLDLSSSLSYFSM